MTRRSTGWWMGTAFVLAFCVAAVSLAVWGTGEKGIIAALRMTARLSFLLFWPAYVGSPLAALLGPRFLPIKRRGRDLGLAFAAAQLVHAGLVAWLCVIGAAPGAATFVIFGIALAFVYLLALFSVDRIRQAVGPSTWWVLRVVGMNYIAFAFTLDFWRGHPLTQVGDLILYGPFLALSVAGILLNIVTLALSVPWRSVFRRDVPRGAGKWDRT
jgi:hypothetical protein